MDYDRRIMGEADEFFEPTDLGFVMPPPAVPAQLPGPSTYEGFTPEAMQYITRQNALPGRGQDIRDVLADDFQLYKQLGQTGDTWGGKTTTYQAYDPYGGAGEQFDVTESGLEKGLEIAAKMGASLAATAGLGAPLGQFLGVPAAYAPAVGNAILGGISSGDMKGAVLGGLGSLAQAGMGNVVKDIGSGITRATDIPALGDAAMGAIRSAVQAAPGALLADDPSRILTGALTGGVSSAISSLAPSLEDLKLSNDPNLNSSLIKAGQDLVGAAVGSAITGRGVDVVNTLLPNVADYISTEFKVPPGQVNTLLNTAVKAASGDKLGLNDLMKIGSLLGASATPPAPDTGDEKARLEARYPATASADAAAPITPISFDYGALPPPTTLSDEFISSLMPEDEVARTFPVTSNDVQSITPIDVTGQREASTDIAAFDFMPRGDTEKLTSKVQAPTAQQIETVGKREEGLDQPLDIYLPELFGGPPALPGSIEGPSTVETVAKRPDEDLLAPLIDAGLEEEDQRARTEPTLPPGRIEGPSTVETVAKRPDEDLLSSLINAGLEEEDQRARTESTLPLGKVEGPTTIETVAKRPDEDLLAPLIDAGLEEEDQRIRTEPPARPGQLQGPSEIEVVGKREEDQPLDIYMSELFGGPPPRAGELQGPSTIDITGKRPVDLTPIDSVLDIDKIMREEVEIPNRPTLDEMAEKILPPVSPVLPPAPPPVSPPLRPVTPVSPPSTKTGGGFDLSGLMALLGMLAAQREGKEEAYQTANVAPGVESGLRAIEQMYGTRRG